MKPFQVVHYSWRPPLFETRHELCGVQLEVLLQEDLDIGADICRLLVDVAVEASDTLLLQVSGVMQHLGLESVSLGEQLLLAADTACTVAHRGTQKLLDESILESDSSSTIDLGVTDTEGSGSGSCTLVVPDHSLVHHHQSLCHCIHVLCILHAQ